MLINLKEDTNYDGNKKMRERSNKMWRKTNKMTSVPLEEEGNTKTLEMKVSKAKW